MSEKIGVNEESWKKKKLDLLDGIDVVLASGSENKDVLELMKELVATAKIRTSIEEYYEDNV